MRFSQIFVPVALLLAPAALAAPAPDANNVARDAALSLPGGVQSYLSQAKQILTNGVLQSYLSRGESYLAAHPSAFAKAKSLIAAEGSLLPSGVAAKATSLLNAEQSLVAGKGSGSSGGSGSGGSSAPTAGAGSANAAAPGARMLAYAGGDAPVFALVVCVAALTLGGGVLL